MLKAIGKYVVLKAVPVEKKKDVETEDGIIIPSQFVEQNEGQEINLPNKNGKVRVRLYIDSIGDAVEYALEKGLEVIVNDYDVQPQGDKDGNIYAICKAESIKAVIV